MVIEHCTKPKGSYLEVIPYAESISSSLSPNALIKHSYDVRQIDHGRLFMCIKL